MDHTTDELPSLSSSKNQSSPSEPPLPNLRLPGLIPRCTTDVGWLWKSYRVHLALLPNENGMPENLLPTSVPVRLVTQNSEMATEIAPISQLARLFPVTDPYALTKDSFVVIGDPDDSASVRQAILASVISRNSSRQYVVDVYLVNPDTGETSRDITHLKIPHNPELALWQVGDPLSAPRGLLETAIQWLYHPSIVSPLHPSAQRLVLELWTAYENGAWTPHSSSAFSSTTSTSSSPFRQQASQSEEFERVAQQQCQRLVSLFTKTRIKLLGKTEMLWVTALACILPYTLEMPSTISCLQIHTLFHASPLLSMASHLIDPLVWRERLDPVISLMIDQMYSPALRQEAWQATTKYMNGKTITIPLHVLCQNARQLAWVHVHFACRMSREAKEWRRVYILAALDTMSAAVLVVLRVYLSETVSRSRNIQWRCDLLFLLQWIVRVLLEWDPILSEVMGWDNVVPNNSMDGSGIGTESPTGGCNECLDVLECILLPAVALCLHIIYVSSSQLTLQLDVARKDTISYLRHAIFDLQRQNSSSVPFSGSHQTPVTNSVTGVNVPDPDSTLGLVDNPASLGRSIQPMSTIKSALASILNPNSSIEHLLVLVALIPPKFGNKQFTPDTILSVHGTEHSGQDATNTTIVVENSNSTPSDEISSSSVPHQPPDSVVSSLLDGHNSIPTCFDFIPSITVEQVSSSEWITSNDVTGFMQHPAKWAWCTAEQNIASDSSRLARDEEISTILFSRIEAIVRYPPGPEYSNLSAIHTGNSPLTSTTNAIPGVDVNSPDSTSEVCSTTPSISISNSHSAVNATADMSVIQSEIFTTEANVSLTDATVGLVDTSRTHVSSSTTLLSSCSLDRPLSNVTSRLHNVLPIELSGLRQITAIALFDFICSSSVHAINSSTAIDFLTSSSILSPLLSSSACLSHNVSTRFSSTSIPNDMISFIDLNEVSSKWRTMNRLLVSRRGELNPVVFPPLSVEEERAKPVLLSLLDALSD